MPQTHPLYHIYADDTHGELGRCCGFRPSAYAVARPLDVALEQAAACQASSYFNTYSVQPVPGTEPRYKIVCSEPGGVVGVSGLNYPPHFDNYDYDNPRLTWAEASAIWHLNSLSHDNGFYRIVQV